jgi:hypothetical protein
MNIPLADAIDIDHGAPVISREEMLIEAPVETVWNLHVGINAWTTWRADVDSAQLADTFAVGSAFRWQTAGLHITSTIMHVIPFSRTAWGGPADGIDGVHVWEFSPRDNGVLVRTRESWSGAPVQANTPALQSALDESLQVCLRDLRAAAISHHQAP